MDVVIADLANSYFFHDFIQRLAVSAGNIFKDFLFNVQMISC